MQWSISFFIWGVHPAIPRTYFWLFDQDLLLAGLGEAYAAPYPLFYCSSLRMTPLHVHIHVFVRIILEFFYMHIYVFLFGGHTWQCLGLTHDSELRDDSGLEWITWSVMDWTLGWLHARQMPFPLYCHSRPRMCLVKRKYKYSKYKICRFSFLLNNGFSCF